MNPYSATAHTDAGSLVATLIVAIGLISRPANATGRNKVAVECHVYH